MIWQADFTLDNCDSIKRPSLSEWGDVPMMQKCCDMYYVESTQLHQITTGYLKIIPLTWPFHDNLTSLSAGNYCTLGISFCDKIKFEIAVQASAHWQSSPTAFQWIWIHLLPSETARECIQTRSKYMPEFMLNNATHTQPHLVPNHHVFLVTLGSNPCSDVLNVYTTQMCSLQYLFWSTFFHTCFMYVLKSSHL